MSMTPLEKKCLVMICDLYRSQGLHPYALALTNYHFNLTEDPEVVGYMEPSKGRIVINRGLSLEDAALVCRHEILHFRLLHEARLLKKLAEEAGLDYKKLVETDRKKLIRDLYSDSIFNYAADFEISNKGYTEEDKERIRKMAMKVGDDLKAVPGLVTEDQYPGWENDSIEEMYDKLRDIQKKAKEDMKNNKAIVIHGTYVDKRTFHDQNGSKVRLR